MGKDSGKQATTRVVYETPNQARPDSAERENSRKLAEHNQQVRARWNR